MPPLDCVHVQINVHGYEADVTVHVGLLADSSCASLRSSVEQITGLELPLWSDSTAFTFDYSETMRELLARAESMDDEFEGIVVIDAFQYPLLQDTAYSHKDANDEPLLDMFDYVSLMQDLEPARRQRQHRPLKVIAENFTGSGRRFYAESVDTGVSMSYLWLKFDQGIPRSMLQFVYRGRSLPSSGPLPFQERDVGNHVKLRVMGNLLGQGKRLECPSCGQQCLQYSIEQNGACNDCVQKATSGQAGSLSVILFLGVSVCSARPALLDLCLPPVEARTSTA